MTSRVLLQSLVRFMGRSDPADCDAQQLVALLACLNRAISQWHDTQPDALRVVTLNPLLRAPAAAAVDILPYASGFTVAGNALGWLASHMDMAVGCSAFLSGDTQRNMLIGAGTLARHYIAEGSGSALLTVHFDAARLGPRFLRLTNQPAVTNGLFHELLNALDISEFHQMQRRCFKTTGIPKYFAIQPMNTGNAQDPAFLVRVSPAPQQELTLELSVSQRAPQISLAESISDHAIAVPDDDITAYVRPVTIMHMVSEGLVNNQFDGKALTLSGQTAMAFVGSTNIQTNAVPARVGTRRRW